MHGRDPLIRHPFYIKHLAFWGQLNSYLTTAEQPIHSYLAGKLLFMHPERRNESEFVSLLARDDKQMKVSPRLRSSCVQPQKM